MIKISEKSKCCGCSACSSICPQNCIKMEHDSEGFLYPSVNTSQCIGCGLCEKVCPIISHGTAKHNGNVPMVYAALNTDEKTRLESSSGGIFTLLANWIISQGGIVYGAAFSNDCKSVCHIAVDTLDGLEKLRGSKYVQSAIGNTYKKAKNALDSGRLVLFTGTPCQIGGLYSFLKKDYDNLYTQDLICHGVPSPLVWKKYVELREQKAMSKTRRTFFRHKKYGWKTFSVLFKFANSTEYVKILFEDFYMRGFLANLYLRPSCYECSFKGLHRQSDITLADFWGVQNVCPEMDDDNGTSLVLINSEKGKELFNHISSKTKSCLVDYECVLKYNSAAVESAKLPAERNEFFETMRDHDLEYSYKKFCSVKLTLKVKRRIHKYLSKIKHLIKGDKK